MVRAKVTAYFKRKVNRLLTRLGHAPPSNRIDLSKLRHMTPDKVLHTLEQANWKYLGQGGFATAMASPCGEYVARVSSQNDPLAQEVARLSKAYADNPHLPKVYLSHPLEYPSHMLRGRGHLTVLERLKVLEYKHVDELKSGPLGKFNRTNTRNPDFLPEDVLYRRNLFNCLEYGRLDVFKDELKSLPDRLEQPEGISTSGRISTAQFALDCLAELPDLNHDPALAETITRLQTQATPATAEEYYAAQVEGLLAEIYDQHKSTNLDFYPRNLGVRPEKNPHKVSVPADAHVWFDPVFGNDDKNPALDWDLVRQGKPQSYPISKSVPLFQEKETFVNVAGGHDFVHQRNKAVPLEAHPPTAPDDAAPLTKEADDTLSR